MQQLRLFLVRLCFPQPSTAPQGKLVEYLLPHEPDERVSRKLKAVVEGDHLLEFVQEVCAIHGLLARLGRGAEETLGRARLRDSVPHACFRHTN